MFRFAAGAFRQGEDSVSGALEDQSGFAVGKASSCSSGLRVNPFNFPTGATSEPNPLTRPAASSNGPPLLSGLREEALLVHRIPEVLK